MAHHFIKNLYGGLAQLGERLPCKQEVTGSIPVLSTIRIENGELRIKELTEVPKKFEASLSSLKEKLKCTLKTEH